VVVDYAHTDDGLWNVLKAAREMCSGRVLVVFGCGGDRDRTKRPKMAAVAGELADFSIITSDNPRSEEPLRIMKDAEAGMKALGKREGADYLMIENRAEAIAKGVEMARDGDLLMIAGKGHEDYQIIGERRIHFDDREVARNVLKEGRS
jgi:UDP-N-acetylmuramoyl-L-alanyl-D-glutamate--2,6-diaminopimelate ligase